MRPATAADLDRVGQILDDGRAAIATLGIDQWQGGWPNREAAAQDLAAGACYVAERLDGTGALVGTLALRLNPDPDYEAAAQLPWLTPSAAATSAAGQPQAYAAIHRVAVAAEAARQGVMSSMFTQAEELVRAAGCRSIRVDTHPGNTVMQAFLASRGFAPVGPFDLVTIEPGSTPRRIAYEKLIYW